MKRQRQDGRSTRKKRKEPVSRVYQLKISLRYSEPEIWRRVLVPGEITLTDLHRVIQIAMPWQDCHLHLFEIGDKIYSNPNMQVERAHDETVARLFRLVPEQGGSFDYEYDFGDSWHHTIVVENIAEQDERYPGYPVCISGERACPPEDCGGIPGYANLLEALADPSHPDHGDKLDWLGGRLDPERFDSVPANREMEALRRQRWAHDV